MKTKFTLTSLAFVISALGMQAHAQVTSGSNSRAGIGNQGGTQTTGGGSFTVGGQTFEGRSHKSRILSGALSDAEEARCEQEAKDAGVDRLIGRSWGHTPMSYECAHVYYSRMHTSMFQGKTKWVAPSPEEYSAWLQYRSALRRWADDGLPKELKAKWVNADTSARGNDFFKPFSPSALVVSENKRMLDKVLLAAQLPSPFEVSIDALTAKANSSGDAKLDADNAACAPSKREVLMTLPKEARGFMLKDFDTKCKSLNLSERNAQAQKLKAEESKVNAKMKPFYEITDADFLPVDTSQNKPPIKKAELLEFFSQNPDLSYREVGSPTAAVTIRLVMDLNMPESYAQMAGYWPAVLDGKIKLVILPVQGIHLSTEHVKQALAEKLGYDVNLAFLSSESPSGFLINLMSEPKSKVEDMASSSRYNVWGKRTQAQMNEIYAAEKANLLKNTIAITNSQVDGLPVFIIESTARDLPYTRGHLSVGSPVFKDLGITTPRQYNKAQLMVWSEYDPATKRQRAYFANYRNKIVPYGTDLVLLDDYRGSYKTVCDAPGENQFCWKTPAN